MSSPSNLYAEKVYAEQPIALWALDDDANFVSYYSQSDLNVVNTSGVINPNWTVSGNSGIGYLPSNSDPFPILTEANTVQVIGSNPGDGNSSTITLTGPSFVSSLDHFGIGFYFNSQSSSITSVSIKVGDLDERVTAIDSADTWTYIQETFTDTFATGKSLVIKINYNGSASSQDPYFVAYINGISIGYNQEFFGTRHIGNFLSAIDSSISVSGYGILAKEYGLGQNNGYYLGNNTTKKLYSKNSSVPLVFGSRSSTILYPNDTSGQPSLIIPGFGFLNDAGKNSKVSLECWVRIKSTGSSTSPFRIMGPVQSDDGVYVHGQHLVLKINDKISAHYVGEWFRPMLINIEYSPTKAIMFVNGETVASIDSPDTSMFPQKYSNTGKNQDYIGFYAGSTVDFIEVDCLAIYPYGMSNPLLKRRFGYGQAVVPPTNLESSYGGKQLFVDYTFANYSFDYAYPRIESWASSIRDNVYTDSRSMGSPVLGKPPVLLSNTLTSTSDDTSEWLSDLVSLNDTSPDSISPYVKIRPASRWQDISGYVYLDRIQNKGMSAVDSIYAAFNRIDVSTEEDPNDQILMKIEDKDSYDSMSISLQGNSIVYSYDISGSSGTLKTTALDDSKKSFVVGLSISSLTEYLLSSQSQQDETKIVKFLSGINKYAMYVGGEYSGSEVDISTTFTGKIYKVGVSSASQKSMLSSYFTNGLIKDTASVSAMVAINPTYAIGITKQTFGNTKIYDLNYSTTSYWQDYLPLNKMAKVSSGPDGDVYKSNMLQISIDSATPKETVTIDNVKYVDTSSSDVKTYVYFAYPEEMTPDFGKSFTSSEKIKSNMVIDARASWHGKLFEVVDGAIVILPESGFRVGSDQTDLLLVTVVEVFSKSPSDMPVRIRTLEYAAQTFGSFESNTFEKSLAKAIGTRSSSQNMYPFVYSGGKFSYDSYNPMTISKISSPYLYLTEKTGIKVLDSYSSSLDRGIAILVNEKSEPDFNLSSIIFSALYNEESMPSSEMTVMEVYDSYYEKVKISISQLGTTNLAKVSVKSFRNNAWVDISGVEVYINGTYAVDPIIVNGEWATIGIVFVSKPLIFSEIHDGRIEIVGSVLVNNISYFQIPSDQLSQQTIYNEWNDYSVAKTWEQLTGISWIDVSLTTAPSRPKLTPDLINDIYYGTNKIVSIGDEDDTGIRFGSYQYSVFDNVYWQNSATVAP